MKIICKVCGQASVNSDFVYPPFVINMHLASALINDHLPNSFIGTIWVNA